MVGENIGEFGLPKVITSFRATKLVVLTLNAKSFSLKAGAKLSLSKVA